MFWEVRAFRSLQYSDISHRQNLSGVRVSVTQSRNEVKGWVRSNAGMLLHSCRDFEKAVYQEMLEALWPLTPSSPSPLNTVPLEEPLWCGH